MYTIPYPLLGKQFFSLKTCIAQVHHPSTEILSVIVLHWRKIDIMIFQVVNNNTNIWHHRNIFKWNYYIGKNSSIHFIDYHLEYFQLIFIIIYATIFTSILLVFGIYNQWILQFIDFINWFKLTLIMIAIVVNHWTDLIDMDITIMDLIFIYSNSIYKNNGFYHDKSFVMDCNEVNINNSIKKRYKYDKNLN